MSLSTVRAELKTILESITSVGTVHDYKRYTHDWASYKTLFVENSKVNTWEIVRDNVDAWVEASNSVNRRRHYFTIRGFYAINDENASEKTFQNIVEDIIDELRDKPTLNDKAEKISFDKDDPLTAVFSTDFLGAVLCHIVEIKINILEYTTF